MAMYTTTFISIFHTNILVLLGLVALLLVVGIRLVPLGFTRLIILITLVTLVTFSLILFLLSDKWILNQEEKVLHNHVQENAYIT